MENSNKSRRKVVITRNLGKSLELLSPKNNPNGGLPPEEWDIVIWAGEEPCSRDYLEDMIKGAEGVLVMLTDKVDEGLMELAGSNLKVVSTMSVGYDHVELSALTKRGIKLGFTPDVLTNAVADITLMLALMATRNAGEAISIVKSGTWGDLGWGPFTLCGPQIGTTDHKGKPYTVGFLGFGRIAQATLRRLVPFGITRCIYTNTSTLDSLGPEEPTSEDIRLTRTLEIKHVYAVPLSYLAKESDLVIVLAPGGRQTHHIVDRTFLKAMKATSVLVNTSRGTLVDTDALVLALQEKWIWGAGLDVIEGEPHIKADHPLLKQPRAVVLPHIGSATIDTREAMANLAVVNLVNGVLGKRLEREAKI